MAAKRKTATPKAVSPKAASSKAASLKAAGPRPARRRARRSVEKVGQLLTPIAIIHTLVVEPILARLRAWLRG